MKSEILSKRLDRRTVLKTAAAAGVDVTAIGYRGYPQMVPDIASGLITSTFLSANQALAQV